LTHRELLDVLDHCPESYYFATGWAIWSEKEARRLVRKLIKRQRFIAGLVPLDEYDGSSSSESEKEEVLEEPDHPKDGKSVVGATSQVSAL